MSETTPNIPNGGKKTLEFIAFSNLYPEPKVTIKRGKQWIEFGEDNQLPEYVVGLLDKSPDHAAIVNGTIQFCHGNGLVLPKGNSKAQALYQNGEENVISPNDLNKIQEKLFRDLVVHGHCLINLRWSRDRSGIGDVHYVDVKKARLDVDGEGFWISNDWLNIRKEENKPEFFPAFTQEEGGSQLLYVKLSNARSFPYGMPSYWSARQAIELQDELLTFDLNRVRSNFFTSVIFKFDDVPTTEEQDINHKSMKKFLGGSKGEKGMMSVYGQGVEILPFESSVAPKDFVIMQQVADERIRAAHRVCGRGGLFGLSRGDGGILGSREDLETEFETYAQIVVRPIQNTILSVWNMISQVNGVGHSWEIEPFQLFADKKVDTAEKGDAASESETPPTDAN